VTQAPVAELTQCDGGGLVRVCSADDERLRAALAAAGFDVTAIDGGLHVAGGSAAEVGLVAMDAGVALTRLQPVAIDLEEVFMELTGGGGIG
jgi:ABC-2 type transport system ATP-binding protein